MKPSRSSKKVQVDSVELKKRRREMITVIALGLLFLSLTWVEFYLFEKSQSLPFVHSIFFFGLVNFNIIVFLFLVFLIFRNFVKNFSEQEDNFIGRSLKSKLIAAFVGFSFVPTALMFLVSVFYINNSFDKWFSEKTSGVLKNAIEVTDEYYLSTKKENYHFAEQIVNNLQTVKSTKQLKKMLQQARLIFRLDSVEYYSSINSRETSVSDKRGASFFPQASESFVNKALSQKINASMIESLGDGNLLRVIVPVPDHYKFSGAIIVSTFIPLSLTTRMDEIAMAYEDFRDKDPLSYPLKSIYLIVLVLMTLVILLGATWFGFYWARQLSIPLEELGKATRRIAKGDYDQVQLTTGSPEINQLIDNFNLMTKNLEVSEHEINEANKYLRSTLSQLDEHSKYMEVVLKNVNTGVVSIDADGLVTVINRYASELLNVGAEVYEGKSYEELLGSEYFVVFVDFLTEMKQKQMSSIEREVQLSINGRSQLFHITINTLLDDAGREVGYLFVFDDLTMVLSAQRAAAWTEVARRIAHEIKNPLTPISLAAQRLQRKFGEEIKDEAFSNCTKMIIQQVDGLKTLVNEFSQFARLPKSSPSLNSLNDVISDALLLFESTTSSVRIGFEPDKALPNFLFDKEQLKRVITNLVDNSVAGLEKVENGCIEISTHYYEKDQLVQVVVKDNGVGIPDEMRARIFEPYVTSKRNGTGLGLAIVKRMVQDHNGYIRAYPGDPVGTKIQIEMPVLMTTVRHQKKESIDYNEGVHS